MPLVRTDRWVSWEESDPEDNWDVVSQFFLFLIAPLMLPVTAGTAAYDFMEGTSHLDRRETIRNSLLWSSIAGASWGYHALMFPGQYSYLSPGAAFRTAGYLGGAPLAAVVIATAAGVGYVATADVHGGAIAMGNPSYGPGVYGSDPMGEFEEGASGAMNFLFGWMF